VRLCIIRPSVERYYYSFRLRPPPIWREPRHSDRVHKVATSDVVLLFLPAGDAMACFYPNVIVCFFYEDKEVCPHMR